MSKQDTMTHNNYLELSAFQSSDLRSTLDLWIGRRAIRETAVVSRPRIRFVQDRRSDFVPPLLEGPSTIEKLRGTWNESTYIADYEQLLMDLSRARISRTVYMTIVDTRTRIPTFSLDILEDWITEED